MCASRRDRKEAKAGTLRKNIMSTCISMQGREE